MTMRSVVVAILLTACSQPSDEFELILRDLDAQYATDYEAFFDEFEKQARHLRSCQDESEVRRFLSLTTEIAGNAEVVEAFAAHLEQLVVDDPNCFLTATDDISDEMAESLAAQLFDPIFKSREELRLSLVRAHGVEVRNPVVFALMRRHAA